MNQSIDRAADAKADYVHDISFHMSGLSRHFNAGHYGKAHFHARRVASICSCALSVDQPVVLMLVKLVHCIDDMLLYAKPTPEYIGAIRPVIDAMEGAVALLEMDI